jgi:hypothetical protein
LKKERICKNNLPNGNTAVFENREHLVEFLESKNIDVMNIIYEFKDGKAKLTRTEEGYNWNFYDDTK